MDPILRIVTVTLLFSVVFGVVSSPHPWRWKLCFALFAIGVSGFTLQNAVTTTLAPNGNLVLATTFFAKMLVLFAWWLVQCSFSDRFRFDLFRLGIGGLWLGMVIHDMWRIEHGSDGPVDYAGPFLVLALMAHLIWFLAAGREDDLRLRRRAARLWLPAAIIGLILIDLGIDLIFGFDWYPAMMIYAQNMSVLFFTLGLAVTTMHVDANRYAAGPIQAPETPEEYKLSNDARRLDQLMSGESLYLNPNLRLSDIVGRLPISEASTRTLIHSKFGCEHFRTFLNRYRIDYAKTLLCDPLRRDDKLIAIAFDSGFASLASFQRAFKREVGQTPSSWRKSNRD